CRWIGHGGIGYHAVQPRRRAGAAHDYSLPMSLPALHRPALQQRCWNHEAREAVCLCPACGRSFCRECVTEHQSRLLCAACLQALARATGPGTRGKRRLASAGLALAGILLAWIFIFGAGEAIMTFSARLEQTQWQNR